MKKYLEILRPYVLPALAVLLGVMFYKRIMVMLGLAPDPAETAKVDKEKKQQNSDLVVLQNSGVTPTRPVSFWQDVAEQIYQALRYSAVSDNDQQAIDGLMLVANDADFIVLEREFGYRQEYWFGLPAGVKKPLRVFVADNLSTSERMQVNNNYKSKRISYVV